MSSSQDSLLASEHRGDVAASVDDIAIRVSNLSKCFQIYDTPRDRLKQFVAPHLQNLIRHPPKQYFREFWALKDVSFEIKKGETVGIIGRNGSGKSTLLQIICGTLTPTSGAVRTSGRIAALLELGSGFNPEFSGRENVYMNAAVLGLSKEEVDARFDDIAAFADIGEFIDQPVKTYSSGMQVRLAFAVAINVDPEILVVDEALSVGDELFQRKCFSRIEAIRAKGATILFVSHAGGTIVELCDRAILIDAGEKLAVGMPKQIVGWYQKLLYAPNEKRSVLRAQIRSLEGVDHTGVTLKEDRGEHQVKDGAIAVKNVELQESYDPNLKPQSTVIYESNGAFIEAPQVLTLSGQPVNNLVCGETYRYVFMVNFDRTCNDIRFGLMVKTTSGIELGGAVSAPSVAESIPVMVSGSQVKVEFQFRCTLNTGTYFLNAGVVGTINDAETYIHRLVDAMVFRVLPDYSNLATGIVDFNCVPVLSIGRSKI